VFLGNKDIRQPNSLRDKGINKIVEDRKKFRCFGWLDFTCYL